jgi:hypothetical protein
MIKTIKNISSITQQVFGIELNPGDVYTIPSARFLRLADDIRIQDKIYNLISSGAVAVGDGSVFFNISEGLDWAQRLSPYSSVALSGGSVVSDSESLDFRGNVAVEKSGKVSIIRIGSESNIGSIYSVRFSKNGSGNNKILDGNSDNIEGDGTPTIIPFTSKLVAFTFSNDNNSVDTDIQLWKSNRNQGTSTSAVTEFPLRNARTYIKNNIIGLPLFYAGDKIVLYAEDMGKNPLDLEVVLYFKVYSDEAVEILENFSGDLNI